MNPTLFKVLLRELIDENPFALRAVLKLLDIEFTDQVSTLAVTREDQPRLLVNLSFVREHCSTEEHVKALICHEFLHILLRHTEGRGPLSVSEHLAKDAVINSIIHRELGPSYSSMMGGYYANAQGVVRILRPMTGSEDKLFRALSLKNDQIPQWVRAWKGLYDGLLVVDDIRDLSEEFVRGLAVTFNIDSLLGNHEEMDSPLPDWLTEALNDTMRALNGSGIWRSPRGRGIGALPYEALFTAKDAALARWNKTTADILKKHLLPDRRSRIQGITETVYRMPVLNAKDRRAFLRSLWDRFIPEAVWESGIPKRSGTAQVYLDVSGSMNAEMPHLITLLNRLRHYIKMPFWAFSDEVTPAIIRRGQLKTRTSGGTSMACVLEHLAKTRPAAAVVITDGYIEELPLSLVGKVAGVRLHTIVSRDGNPSLLDRAGIPYTQLDRSPS